MLVALLSLSCLASNAAAQHSHGRRNTAALEYESIPAHNAVLAHAPEDLVLRFSEYVRMMKFTLKANDTASIALDFKFSMDASRVFIQKLPALPPAAEFYTAEWAALNVDNVIVYGLLRFAVGVDAKNPQTIIDARSFPSAPFLD